MRCRCCIWRSWRFLEFTSRLKCGHLEAEPNREFRFRIRRCPKSIWRPSRGLPPRIRWRYRELALNQWWSISTGSGDGRVFSDRVAVDFSSGSRCFRSHLSRSGRRSQCGRALSRSFSRFRRLRLLSSQRPLPLSGGGFKVAQPAVGRSHWRALSSRNSDSTYRFGTRLPCSSAWALVCWQGFFRISRSRARR